MLSLVLLLACAGGDDTGALPPPTIAFLSPSDGDSVTAGSVDVALVVEEFTLVAVEATRIAKHSEGAPEGFIDLRVDGTSVVQSGETNFPIELQAGAHELVAELLYADGDPLDPPVSATISVTAN